MWESPQMPCTLRELKSGNLMEVMIFTNHRGMSKIQYSIRLDMVIGYAIFCLEFLFLQPFQPQMIKIGIWNISVSPIPVCRYRHSPESSHSIFLIHFRSAFSPSFISSMNTGAMEHFQ
jgi:hypothetical protein